MTRASAYTQTPELSVRDAWSGIRDLVRRMLLPPWRRRQSDFALECAAERLFRFVAYGVGDLGNGLRRLALLDFSSLYAPGG